jgi:hypothetical protein
VTWENAALLVPIRGFVSQHLSMSLGFFRCRAPHTRPKEVGFNNCGSCASARVISLIAASVNCGYDVAPLQQPNCSQPWLLLPAPGRFLFVQSLLRIPRIAKTGAVEYSGWRGPRGRPLRYALRELVETSLSGGDGAPTLGRWLAVGASLRARPGPSRPRAFPRSRPALRRPEVCRPP